MNNIMSYEQYQYQQKQQDLRLKQYLQCKNPQDRKQFHKYIFQVYHQEVKLNWEKEYKEQRGWGIVKPIVDLRKMAPLCNYPFRSNSLKGCNFCAKKKYWYDVIDPDQEVWALYFSMNLAPLWTKLRKRWPHWTTLQVQNNRYWRATKHKLLKELEHEFLESHPGPWCRALNRAPIHITYTYAIWYNKTLEQTGIYLRWPPEPYPITIQFVGRPKPGVDLSWGPFILDEKAIDKKQMRKVKEISDQEVFNDFNLSAKLSSADFEN